MEHVVLLRFLFVVGQMDVAFPIIIAARRLVVPALVEKMMVSAILEMKQVW